MVGIYKIRSENTSNEVPFSETAILKVIKALEGRDKTTQKHYIELWENLEGKKFKKKYLELI